MFGIKNFIVDRVKSAALVSMVDEESAAEGGCGPRWFYSLATCSILIPGLSQVKLRYIRFSPRRQRKCK